MKKLILAVCLFVGLNGLAASPAWAATVTQRIDLRTPAGANVDAYANADIQILWDSGSWSPTFTITSDRECHGSAAADC